MKRKLNDQDEEYNLASTAYHYDEDRYDEDDYDYDEYRHSDLPMDNRFYTKLHHAAERGDKEWCEEILGNHPKAVTDTTESGHIPLDLAATNGHLEACKILLDHMEVEDIYAERADGYTTFGLILMQQDITESHHKIFKMLMDRVPNSKVPKDDIVEFVITNNNNSQKIVVNFKELLYLAASKGAKSICEMILKNTPGAAREESGQSDSAIRVAAANNFPEIVDLLIANMTLKDIGTALFKEKTNVLLPNKATVRSPALLSTMCSLVSDYIVKQSLKDIDLITSETNFKKHFTWLKIYQILSNENLTKTFSCDVSKNHRQFLSSVQKHLCENFFKFIGVCKDIAKEYPFSLLSKDCMGNIIDVTMKTCYPALDLNPANQQVEAVEASIAGQDNDLS